MERVGGHTEAVQFGVFEAHAQVTEPFFIDVDDDDRVVW